MDEMIGGGVIAGDAVMLTGPAGSGKSTIATQFIAEGLRTGETGVIAVFEEYPEDYLARADVRNHEIGEMIRAGKLELIYLEASDATIVSRFSETRHRHPLQETRSSIQASIAEERRRLARTRDLADHVIDTSGFSIAQLKDRVFATLPRDAVDDRLVIDIVTFGFKYGIPLEADVVLDVRFLTNPYWNPDLKPLSGLEEPVRDFVLGQPAANRYLDLVTELLQLTVPAYLAEGRQQLRVALGCTGGYHRSIALAEELGRRLETVPNASVNVFHRELGR